MRRAVALIAAAMASVIVPGTTRAQSSGVAGFLARADVVNPRLLDSPAVARELKLDSEQLQQVQGVGDEARFELQKHFSGHVHDVEGMRKVIERWIDGQTKVLRPEQRKRLTEIHLQHFGVSAFADPAIQKRLDLGQAQKTRLGPIVENHNQSTARLFLSYGHPIRRADRVAAQRAQANATAELAAQTDREISAVLTHNQRKLWQDMLGQRFDFDAQE